MAKITRVTAKIFGETADATLADPEIGQFGSAKAGTYNGTADVATIQGLAAWSNGWVAAVTPTQQFPPLPEMTGVHKVLSYQNAYLLQQGIPEWDSATTYYTNGFCAKGGKLYVSLTDNNLNNDPASDTVNWKETITDISEKMDVDMSNMNAAQSAKDTIMGWMLPDYANKISVDSGQITTEKSYSAPSDGYILFYGLGGLGMTANNYILINDLTVCSVTSAGTTDSTRGNGMLPVSKNDVIKYMAAYQSTDTFTLYFVPMKGV